jgi:putative transposase
MTYNPDIHHRHSIRLREYYYSATGAYFVTICVQGRECLFGSVADGEMRMNDSGRMVESWLCESTNKFPSVEIDTFVVMPNHFHGIICIVGATLRGRPDSDYDEQEGRPHRAAPTLWDIIDWFKTMTTNAYIRGVKQSNWPPFHGRLWQRNYYERIIRNEAELDAARQYIAENPMKWAEDKENPAVVP